MRINHYFLLKPFEIRIINTTFAVKLNTLLYNKEAIKKKLKRLIDLIIITNKLRL